MYILPLVLKITFHQLKVSSCLFGLGTSSHCRTSEQGLPSPYKIGVDNCVFPFKVLLIYFVIDILSLTVRYITSKAIEISHLLRYFSIYNNFSSHMFFPLEHIDLVFVAKIF